MTDDAMEKPLAGFANARSLATISDEELGQRLADGWRHRAPKRLAAQHP